MYFFFYLNQQHRIKKFVLTKHYSTYIRLFSAIILFDLNFNFNRSEENAQQTMYGYVSKIYKINF